MRGVHSEEEDFGGGEGVSMKIGGKLGGGRGDDFRGERLKEKREKSLSIFYFLLVVD